MIFSCFENVFVVYLHVCVNLQFSKAHSVIINKLLNILSRDHILNLAKYNKMSVEYICYCKFIWTAEGFYEFIFGAQEPFIFGNYVTL